MNMHIFFNSRFVEDISEQYDLKNVKILEGCIIAAETFGGEILFFYIGGNIFVHQSVPKFSDACLF